MEKSTIMHLQLHFSGNLAESDKALNVIRQYNQSVKDLKNLGYLQYDHNKTNGFNDGRGNSVETIVKLIEQVNKI